MLRVKLATEVGCQGWVRFSINFWYQKYFFYRFRSVSIYFQFGINLFRALYDILLQVLKPEPAERVAMMMVMLIDGAIAAQQAESAECREIPPGVTAWSAAKALIYSEGGTL